MLIYQIQKLYNDNYRDCGEKLYPHNFDFLLFPKWSICTYFRATTSLGAAYTLNPIGEEICHYS